MRDSESIEIAIEGTSTKARAGGRAQRGSEIEGKGKMKIEGKEADPELEGSSREGAGRGSR